MTRHYLITIGLIVLAFMLGDGCGGSDARKEAQGYARIAEEALEREGVYRDSTEYFKARADRWSVVHDTVIVTLTREERRTYVERKALQTATQEHVKRTIQWANAH